jgi:hypothetical protein
LPYDVWFVLLSQRRQAVMERKRLLRVFLPAASAVAMVCPRQRLHYKALFPSIRCVLELFFYSDSSVETFFLQTRPLDIAG